MINDETKKYIEDKMKVILKKEEENILNESKLIELKRYIEEELKKKENEFNIKIAELEMKKVGYEILFVWDVENKNNDTSTKNLSTILNQKLFGRFITKKLKDGINKKYFIDGILQKKGVNGEIENISKFNKRWESSFSIPTSEIKFRDDILNLFKNMNIQVTEYRIIENEFHRW